MFSITTHQQAKDWRGEPIVLWKSINVPFARTVYFDVVTAIEAIREYDPHSIYVGEGTDKYSGIPLIIYVGCKGTYLVEQHQHDPYANTVHMIIG